MPADLDLSPEAVERLAEALMAQEQADMDGVMVKVSRQACDESAATLRALAAENARLRAERDEQQERAEEAESEITRAQEQVSAEFEGDCWMAMRNLLDTTGFDWSEYSEDGVSASEAQRWIVEELDRLEAERDAAWQAGAEAPSRSPDMTDFQAKARVENDVIVITLSVESLQLIALGAWGAGYLDPIRITDAKAFAKAMCQELNNEDEDGTTPIHRLFDNAILQAFESGEGEEMDDEEAEALISNLKENRHD